jgi:WD40 repeat protein
MILLRSVHNLKRNLIWDRWSKLLWLIGLISVLHEKLTLSSLVSPLSVILTIQFECRGVRAISSLANGSTFYTAGVDGMVCATDFTTGKLLEKFKASSKAVSCISVSPGMHPSQLLQNSCFLCGRKWNQCIAAGILTELICT